MVPVGELRATQADNTTKPQRKRLGPRKAAWGRRAIPPWVLVRFGLSTPQPEKASWARLAPSTRPGPCRFRHRHSASLPSSLPAPEQLLLGISGTIAQGSSQATTCVGIRSPLPIRCRRGRSVVIAFLRACTWTVTFPPPRLS